MKINNLIGVSGSINSGKDLVGEMLQYIDLSDNPTYDEFQYEVNLEPNYVIKKCAEKLKEVIALVIGCKRSDLEDEVFKNTELGKEWWRYERTLGIKTVIITQLEYDGLSTNQQIRYNLVKLTPRMMLQQFGTQGGRMVTHPNIWVNALFADYVWDGKSMTDGWIPTYNNPDNSGGDIEAEPIMPQWIITDIRFPDNEGVAVSSRGGLLIGIKRHFALKFPRYAFREIPGKPYEVPVMLQNDNEKLFDSLLHESERAMGDHLWCDVIIENNGTKEELFNNVLSAVNSKLEKV